MFFRTYINDLPNDHTLYYKCDQSSDLWQQVQLVPELELDLWDTGDWVRKWLVDFNAGKTPFFSYDLSNNCAIDVKMNESNLDKKSSFKMLGLSLSSKLDWGSKKLGTLICSMKFLLFISINPLYGLAWNIFVMSRLVLLAAIWIWRISHKNGYVRLSVLQ